MDGECAACGINPAVYPTGDGALCEWCFNARENRAEDIKIAGQMIGGGAAAIVLGLIAGTIGALFFIALDIGGRAGQLVGLLAAPLLIGGVESMRRGFKKRKEIGG